MKNVNYEIFVSLEVAKLLKEAGFDWECIYAYLPTTESGNELVKHFNKPTDYNHVYTPILEIYSAPTLDVAQRWLREVKEIDVVISRAMQWKQFYYSIEHEENRTSKIDFMSLNKDMWWFKYEEAQEAGIKKALELILKKGE